MSTIADGEDIFECLRTLQLTEFIDFLISSDTFAMLLNTSDDSQFTIFAPTNAAFEAMRSELEASQIPLDTLAGHYIIPDSRLMESDLGFNMRFNTLSNTTLHTTVVQYADRTLQYNPSYSTSHHSNLIRYTNVSLT
jgi:hypothetical protein